MCVSNTDEFEETAAPEGIGENSAPNNSNPKKIFLRFVILMYICMFTYCLMAVCVQLFDLDGQNFALSTLINLSFVLTQVLLLFDFAYVITSSPSKSIYRWGQEPMSVKDLHESERALTQVRGISFAFALFALFLYPPLREGAARPIALQLCIPFNCTIIFFCSVQQLIRFTFRRWPNIIISIGNAFLYLAFVEVLDPNPNLFGVVPFNISLALEGISEMKIPVLEILATAGLSAYLVEAYKKSISGISEEDPTTVSQGRKRTRRKILGHWQYKPEKIIFSGENAVVKLFAGIPLYIGVFILAIARSRTDGAYLAIIALVFYLSGIFAHWNIDNDRLIQSEYFYLLYMGGHLDANDIRESTVLWRDYRQILVEFYSNISSLDSEDHYLHKIDNLLKNIWDTISHDCCASEKFISDILQAKGDINEKIMRESSFRDNPSNTDSTPVSSDLKKAQDVLFSCDMVKLLDHYIEKSTGMVHIPKQLEEYSPIELLTQATNWFFDNHEEAWTLRLSGCGIGAEEAIALLRIDTLIHILQMNSHKDCALFWMECRQEHTRPSCSKDCKCDTVCAKPDNCRILQHLQDVPNSGGELDTFRDMCMVTRMELLVNYPMFVRQSFKRRWRTQLNSYMFAEDADAYYKIIYDHKMFAGSQNAADPDKSAMEQIEKATERIIRRLAESKQKDDFLSLYGSNLKKTPGAPSAQPLTVDTHWRFTNTQQLLNCKLDPSGDRKWHSKVTRYEQFTEPPCKRKAEEQLDFDQIFKITYHLFYHSKEEVPNHV